MVSVKIIQELWKVSVNISEETMLLIFGKQLGKHLWAKYRRLDFDLLSWWGELDTANRELLVTAINLALMKEKKKC